MKKRTLIINFVLIAIFWFALPAVSVRAMSMSVDYSKNAVHVGDTVLLKITLNTDGKEINVIDGDITFSSPSDVTSISTGGSIFKLWPRKPSLERNKILFTGGTPSGVFGSSLQVFTVAVKPKTAKPIKINFENVAAHLNDGAGTRISVKSSAVEIPVLAKGDEKDELASLFTLDETPPLPFDIELGRDLSLYDGKYFISFYAEDKDSGIDMYMVKEEGHQEVRSGSVYVLQNQNLSGKVEVKAIDNAGNTRTQTLDLKGGSTWKTWVKTIINGAFIIAIFVAALLVIFYFGRRISRKFRKK